MHRYKPSFPDRKPRIPACTAGHKCAFDLKQRLACPFWAAGTFSVEDGQVRPRHTILAAQQCRASAGCSREQFACSHKRTCDTVAESSALQMVATNYRNLSSQTDTYTPRAAGMQHTLCGAAGTATASLQRQLLHSGSWTGAVACGSGSAGPQGSCAQVLLACCHCAYDASSCAVVAVA